jgi:ADP-ribose pyrophosphatase
MIKSKSKSNFENLKNLFNGNFLHIKGKELTLPNKKRINVEFVEHNGAVMIIPFLNDKELVMIKQYRPCINDYLYEFPAGTIEKIHDKNKFESPLDCAKREIIEEINFSAEKWRELGYIYLAPGYSTEKLYIFKAENLKTDTSLEKDEEEFIEIRFFSKTKILNLFKKNLINDAKTIIGLTYIGWL